MKSNNMVIRNGFLIQKKVSNNYDLCLYCLLLVNIGKRWWFK